jgi:hypothetical protein
LLGPLSPDSRALAAASAPIGVDRGCGVLMRSRRVEGTASLPSTAMAVAAMWAMPMRGLLLSIVRWASRCLYSAPAVAWGKNSGLQRQRPVQSCCAVDRAARVSP